MPKSKPSEVEMIAMALAWLESPNHMRKAIYWDDELTDQVRADYRKDARAFLRALRGAK